MAAGPHGLHPHRAEVSAARSRERGVPRPTDRPLSCFNCGIEHVQRQLLNTTCPRSPSRLSSLSLSSSFSVSLPLSARSPAARSVGLSSRLSPARFSLSSRARSRSSPPRSRARGLLHGFVLFLHCHDRGTPAARHAAAQRRMELVSLRFAFFDPPSARRRAARSVLPALRPRAVYPV